MASLESENRHPQIGNLAPEDIQELSAPRQILAPIDYSDFALIDWENALTADKKLGVCTRHVYKASAQGARCVPSAHASYTHLFTLGACIVNALA